MKFEVNKKKSLKDVDNKKYKLCFCTTADFPVDRRYPFDEHIILRLFDKLKEENPDYYNKFKEEKEFNQNTYASEYGDILYTGSFICLVTKLNSFDILDYGNITSSLVKLRDYVRENDIKKIAMSLNIEELCWGVIEDLVKECFEKEDVEILICE